ncbi:ATP-binding protein [Streptacidiphilus sp. PAMC 29251]
MTARIDQTLLLSLPRRARSAAVARHAVSAMVPGAEDARDTTALLVTEVVANAVRHSRGESVLVAASSGRDGVAVAVYDQTPRLKESAAARAPGPQRSRCPQEESASAESGRGLDLVDDLAGSWGVSQVGEAGKWVWFTVAYDPEPGLLDQSCVDQSCLLPVRCA